MALLLLPLLCALLTCLQTPGLAGSDPDPVPQCDSGLTWAVSLGPEVGQTDRQALDLLAGEVAAEAGLESRGQIGQLEGHYLLALPCGQEGGRGHAARALSQHPAVRWHSEQQLLRRAKRSLTFNDPRYPKQWHLHNKVRAGMDINVTAVWEHNVTGAGVTVVVVDDGVQHTLKDIQPNYVGTP
ncbi:UNVERIFIED_CONTAM: hypothetical protein FKN15_041956 [Acipenser sinensis]